MLVFYWKRVLILAMLCYALFLFGNNLLSLTDPDEVFYALTAKEMVAKNTWMTPLIFGQPQFEKPVLTYWLLGAGFKMWGESPFTARLFPALFASLGVMALYFLAWIGFKDERKAFLSALILATSAFFVGMAKTVFTDMIFTVFILGAMTFFVWGFGHRSRRAIGFIGFYVCCALATLTKGPLGLLIPQGTVILFLLYQRQIDFLRNKFVGMGLVLYVMLALPWYLWTYDHYGYAFIQEFFYNDHWRRFLTAEHLHNDRWFFYPLTMVAGLFPWSLLLIAAVADLFKRLKQSVNVMDYLSLSWILVVLCIFQIAHSKLASYILPLFPALALITGNFLGNALFQKQSYLKIRYLFQLSFGVLALLGIGVLVAKVILRRYGIAVEPVYFLSGAWIALAGIGVTLIFKERFEKAVYVLALCVLPIVLTFFMMRSALEGYVSSYQASAYIPLRTHGLTTVLTSKANARGVRYYTGQDVAVVDFSDKPFFSAHPIPILNTAAKIIHVLDHQPETYAVVRKGAYQYMLKYCPPRYHVVLLAKMGSDYILRIVPCQR